MHVEEGQMVQLRDKRIVLVTDATPIKTVIVLNDEEGNPTGETQEFPPENIFVGLLVVETVTDEFGHEHPYEVSGTVTSNMDEVVSIIE